MSDDYSRAVARVVVAQVAELTGFTSVRSSACEALSEVLIRYLVEIGNASNAYATHSGRTDPNVCDVILAFQDMGISLDEVIQYKDFEEETPFNHSLPTRYPCPREKPLDIKTYNSEGKEPPTHIPSHFPILPDTHTYKATPLFNKCELDAKQQRAVYTAQKQQAEAALIRIHQRSRAASRQCAVPDAVPDAGGGYGAGLGLAPPSAAMEATFAALARLGQPREEGSGAGGQDRHEGDAPAGEEGDGTGARKEAGDAEGAAAAGTSGPATQDRGDHPAQAPDRAASIQGMAVEAFKAVLEPQPAAAPPPVEQVKPEDGAEDGGGAPQPKPKPPPQEQELKWHPVTPLDQPGPAGASAPLDKVPSFSVDWTWSVRKRARELCSGMPQENAFSGGETHVETDPGSRKRTSKYGSATDIEALFTSGAEAIVEDD